MHENDDILHFRLCTEADLELANDPFVAAYHFTENRKDLLYQYWLLQPDGWWLALLDAIPVGFGGAVDYGRFSYVGMMAVHPSVQHRGIGEALMQQILAWGAARTCPTLLLNARKQAASLYRRLGFVEEGTVLRFTPTAPVALSLPSTDIRPLQLADLPDLATFDAPYFGADRTKIFTSYLAANPGSSFVSYATTGQITGYIFAESGFLGPWVASTVEDAEQLLIHALSLPFERNPSVTIPASNSDGQRLLERYGFSQQGMNYSMRLGAPTHFRQLSKLYGEASPAFG